MSRPSLSFFRLGALTVAVFLTLSGAALAQTTALFVDSQAGDYIGQGARATVTPAEATFSITRSAKSLVTVSVEGPPFTFWWSITVAVPDSQSLAVGTYESAGRYPFSNGNQLDVSGSSRGCNKLTGRFVVREIAFDTAGAVTSLAADFEQHCEGRDPALFGAIRYHSTVSDLEPFGGLYPVYQLAITPPEHGRVTGQGLECGGASVACVLTLPAASDVALTPVPDPGFMFSAWSGDCEGQTTAIVRVNSRKRCAATFEPVVPGTTALFVSSQAGDFIGGGAVRTYTPADATFKVTRSLYQQGVRVSLLDARSFPLWTIDLVPGNNQPLAVGTYATARRAPFTSFNGLEATTDGRGCNELTGWFVVRELELNLDGTVKRLAADFEQHCEDRAPALFGAVRYRSSLESLAPFDGLYPSYRLTITSPVHGRVEGAGVYCTTGSPSCVLTLPSALTVALTAVPDSGYTFTGWTTDCSGGSTTSVQLNGPKSCSAIFEPLMPPGPRTLLRWDSQPNHYIGEGQGAAFSTANSRWTAGTLSGFNGVQLKVTSVGPRAESSWTLWFQAPIGESLAVNRRYTGAASSNNVGVAGLSIFGNGRACGAGEFTVRDLGYSPDGTVARFAATFVLTCGSASGPRLSGFVQYNSTLGLELTTITIDPPSLRFSSVHSAAAALVKPSPQTVRLTVGGPGVAWTATGSQPWIHVSPATGTGNTPLTITVDVPDGLASAQTVSGRLVISLADGSGIPLTTDVSLTSYIAGTTAAPAGYIDTPLADTSGITGAIPVTGWAVDDVEVTRLAVCRAPVLGELAAADPACGGARQIFIGDAVFIEGARPDVRTAYPLAPRSDSAGWGFMILTNMLPDQGNGTFVLSAYAHDRDGHVALLGTRRVTCDNAHGTTPFGAIDTPSQGETVAGSSYVNFGWALTQSPKAIPPDGSTLMAYVDGIPVGRPSYGHYRGDIASLFPGLANSGGAVGYSIIDTTTLPNGLHTIVWTATDSTGATSGLGSRYFRVANTAAVVVAAPPPALTLASLRQSAPLDRSAVPGRRSWDLETPWRRYEADDAGRVVVRAEELDRIELSVGVAGMGSVAGYADAAGQLGGLPAGSRLDADTGIFTWAPGVGFVGAYDFMFVLSRDGQPVSRREVRIVLEPKGSGRVGPQIVIDTPVPSASARGAFVIGGWAIELDAAQGTGIDAVHVWAYPVQGGPPVFLGAATYGIARPDVAAVHGSRFNGSGYGLVVEGLPPGAYDLAVFAWSQALGTFAPAKVVRVIVE